MIICGDLVQHRYLHTFVGIVLGVYNYQSKQNYMPVKNCAQVWWGENNLMFIDVNKLVKISHNENRRLSKI